MPKIYIKNKKVVVVDQEIDVTDIQYTAMKIKEVRKKTGLTQDDLAKKLCVTRGTIANMETGRHGINIETLLELCKIFNCHSSELLSF